MGTQVGWGGRGKPVSKIPGLISVFFDRTAFSDYRADSGGPFFLKELLEKNQLAPFDLPPLDLKITDSGTT
jgi:hypothetical protein